MTRAVDTRATIDVPVLSAALVFAVLAVLLESSLQIPLRAPGHRAFPPAFVLLLLASRTSPAVLLPLALVLGVLTAVLGDLPLLVLVWTVPAVLLVAARTRSLALHGVRTTIIGIVAGLVVGLLRLFALPGPFHHAPEPARIGGHLLFGALGAAAALVLIRRRSRSY